MGHDHHEPFKIPHYSEYNHWRSIPELANYNKRLERVGLKDPWIRNLVFQFDPKHGFLKSSFAHLKDLLRPGIVPGLIIASSVIALEEGYSFFKHSHTSWGVHH